MGICRSGHYQNFLNKINKIFFIIDGSLKSANDRHGDLSKARQFGWTTEVDTFDGYVQCFDRLKKLNVIPS
jgi:hypothetical protein